MSSTDFRQTLKRYRNDCYLHAKNNLLPIRFGRKFYFCDEYREQWTWTTLDGLLAWSTRTSNQVWFHHMTKPASSRMVKVLDRIVLI